MHFLAIPVGTSAAAITSLAKALDPSRAAAALDGPKTAIPAALRASLTPATKGASGPITTRSVLASRAQFVTDSALLASRFTVVTSWEIPPLPGAQVMSCGFEPVLIKALMIACSRAPEPNTKIFIASSLSRLG